MVMMAVAIGLTFRLVELDRVDGDAAGDARRRSARIIRATLRRSMTRWTAARLIARRRSRC